MQAAAPNAASMKNDPCARLTTPSAPHSRVRPDATRKYSAPLAIPARTCAPSNCQFIGGLSFSATRLLHDRLGRPRSLRGHHFIDRKDCLTVLLALRHLADIDRRICLMVVLGKAHGPSRRIELTR